MTLDSKKHAVDGLASIREACVFLSIGKSSLYNLMKKGLFLAIKNSRAWQCRRT